MNDFDQFECVEFEGLNNTHFKCGNMTATLKMLHILSAVHKRETFHGTQQNAIKRDCSAKRGTSGHLIQKSFGSIVNIFIT